MDEGTKQDDKKLISKMGNGNKRQDKVYIFLSVLVTLVLIFDMVMNYLAGGAGMDIGKSDHAIVICLGHYDSLLSSEFIRFFSNSSLFQKNYIINISLKGSYFEKLVVIRKVYYAEESILHFQRNKTKQILSLQICCQRNDLANKKPV